MTIETAKAKLLEDAVMLLMRATPAHTISQTELNLSVVWQQDAQEVIEEFHRLYAIRHEGEVR